MPPYAETRSGEEEEETCLSLYNKQPPYRAKLKEINGGDVVVNGSLADKAQYKNVLFGRLNQTEERKLHFLCIWYWAILWTAIAGHVSGYYGKSVLCPLVAYLCLKHTVNAHDCNHLKRPLPFVYRLTGYGLFCSGFLPIAATYGDVAHQHITVHHPQTKGVIDHDDPHSRLARMPLWRMILQCTIMPGHICLEDILFHQIPNNPSSLWGERIVTNILHWAQLAILYKLGVPNELFWPCLLAGHVGMVVLWFFFNGLLHYPPFYKFLVHVDPSGLRRIHPIVDGVFRVVSDNAWLEIKWHDLHHAMGVANCTFGTQMARGITYEEIELACANLVDEGLFLDAQTRKPVSPLAEVGHEVGSRKAYLLREEEEERSKKKKEL